MLIVGTGGLGIEIAKNVVLAGVHVKKNFFFQYKIKISIPHPHFRVLLYKIQILQVC